MLFERFYDAGAGAYDRVFGRIPRDFAPALLRMARLTPGLRVLDIATGTGIFAEAAAAAVGPSGHLVAADLSPSMLEGARRRLGALPNVTFAVEDGQALSFPDGHFDAAVCSLGLMLFPDPARGLAEFRRVLRPGGRSAVSVETTPERSFTTRTNAAIGRHVPSRGTPRPGTTRWARRPACAPCSRRRASRTWRPRPRRGPTRSLPSTPTST
jgi:ubiquinone/menaquinone biosynthesis C-methylase UbiE